jgi:hypothetical protein
MITSEPAIEREGAVPKGPTRQDGGPLYALRPACYRCSLIDPCAHHSPTVAAFGAGFAEDQRPSLDQDTAPSVMPTSGWRADQG